MDLKSWYYSDTGDVSIYKAWNLERTGLVTHCFSTRRGGVSASPRDSLNLALHVDDDRACVLENRRILMNALQADPAMLTAAEQVHGCKVSVVTESDAGRGASSFEDAVPGVDALITNVPGPVLSLFYADCVPVYILDPVNRAIGLAHAGWRGTAARVASGTLQAMTQQFGTEPDKCLAAIGPSIGRCCYDVSFDVAMNVKEAVDDERVIARACHEQWRLDLKMANWVTLRRAGVKEKNIAVSDLCTVCRPEDFFSYRRDGQTGRMAAIMELSY